MTFRVFASVARYFVLVVAVISVSCSDHSSAGPDKVPTENSYHLTISTGDGQTARVRNDVPTPLTVRLLDAASRPVPTAQVRWSIQTGDGDIAPFSATTDAQGYVAAAWTLGRSAEVQRVKASFGNQAVLFSATALAGDPVVVVALAGDAQSAIAGSSLTDSVAVQVQDEDGNPVPGVVVNWDVLFGGGDVSPRSNITDRSGTARTAWTLGLEVGSAVVRGSVAGVGESRFSANVLDTEGRGLPSSVTRVVITPEGAAIAAIGAETILTGTAYTDRGQRVQNATIDWTTLSPSIVSVDGGRVTAKAPGTARVIANATCCNKADTALVVVSQQATTLVISPKPVSVPVGGTTSLTATARDAFGVPVTNTPISWSSTNTAVAVVSQGVVTGVANGTVKIRAASGSLLDSASVTVGTVTTSPTVASVSISPASTSVQVSKTLELNATVKDGSGNTLSGQNVSWSSSNTGVATVSSTGRVTGVSAGSANIYATVGNKSGSAQVNVTSTQTSTGTLANVTVNPTSGTISVGATLQLNAAARDANGNVLSGYSFAWSTLNPGIATVNASGVVTAVAPGSATVSASAGGKVASATITVSAPVNVAKLVILPDPVTLTAIGAQAAPTATAYDASGLTLPNQAVSWKSTNAMIATVDSLGRVTARGVGTALIIGTALCCSKADTITVNVTQAIKSVTVSPHIVTIQPGSSSTLTGSALDANWNVVSSASLNWSTTNSQIATVSKGVVSGLTAGTVVIRAVSGSYSDSAIVTVASTTAPAMASLSVNPGVATLSVGDMVQFNATAKDQTGTVMTGQSFTWNSSNSNVLTVSGGRVTAVSTGVAVVRAASGSLADSAIVTVLPAGQFSAPDIASTNFDLGSSAPFTTSDGSSTGNTDVNLLDDPTSSFFGKIARFHFVRTSTAAAPDVDRALRISKGIHAGETVFVRGHVMIPTPQAHMVTAMRKLIYVQTSSPTSSFGVVRANGEQLYVEVTGTTTTARVLGAGSFAFDVTHSVEIQITVNSAPGVPDGILRLWKDGVLVVDVSDVNWINSASAGYNFSRFLFGQQAQGNSTTLFDEYRFWDNLAVSTKRIGPN